MYHHCVGIFDQIHFMRVNVNTMTQQRLLTENVEIHQSVHDTFAIFLQTVMQIFNAFCHMDMIADFIRFVRSCQFHGCIGNCKLCMHTHHTGDHICVIFQCIANTGNQCFNRTVFRLFQCQMAVDRPPLTIQNIQKSLRIIPLNT